MSKTISCLTLIFFIFISHSQTLSRELTGDDLIGTWECEENNQIFRVKLFNEPNNDGRFSTRGHFYMFTKNESGNLELLYTSDRLIEGTNQRWHPMIHGGAYMDYNQSYRFALWDNTGNYFLLGNLHLKFLDSTIGGPIRVSWRLRVDGIPTEGENFNVPTDLILKKIN